MYSKKLEKEIKYLKKNLNKKPTYEEGINLKVKIEQYYKNIDINYFYKFEKNFYSNKKILYNELNGYTFNLAISFFIGMASSLYLQIFLPILNTILKDVFYIFPDWMENSFKEAFNNFLSKIYLKMDSFVSFKNEKLFLLISNSILFFVTYNFAIKVRKSKNEIVDDIIKYELNLINNKLKEFSKLNFNKKLENLENEIKNLENEIKNLENEIKTPEKLKDKIKSVYKNKKIKKLKKLKDDKDEIKELLTKAINLLEKQENEKQQKEN